MALSAATIQTTIKAQLDAQYGAPADAAALAQQTKFCTALANAIFTVLTTQTTVSVTSVSGVTTGGGVSGPGVGVLT
jgi:hypothetical protein